MSNPPRIGLLPLYVKLYDQVLPDLCAELLPFLQEVRAAFQQRGVAVVEAPVCRAADEVAGAVRQFEQEGADLIITLHLAYSPSLESVEALAASRLPVLMLDTTPDRGFGPATDPMRLLNNHGIHGVQDLACMLRRRGKPFTVVAGHLSDLRTMERACAVVAGAHAAAVFRGMRVLRIGPAFAGMGDFQCPDADFEAQLGLSIEEIPPTALRDSVAAVTDDAVEREMHADRDAFEVALDAEVHRRSVRLGLGLRRYLEHGGFGAFSLNFLAFDLETGPLSTVPFLECSKAMARGVGYAGEGDVLTAALVGALNAVGPTTFTEMFCADWAGGSIFLSHMGEFNPAVAAGTPRLYEKPYPFTKTNNPAAIACAPRPGLATLVNLAPGPNGSFGLLATAVEVLGDGTHPDYRDWIRGWIRPPVPVEEFLETYSRHGGTHHCALVLGDCRDAVLAFGQALGLETVELTAKGDMR